LWPLSWSAFTLICEFVWMTIDLQY
jgi:hypothetical protein